MRSSSTSAPRRVVRYVDFGGKPRVARDPERSRQIADLDYFVRTLPAEDVEALAALAESMYVARALPRWFGLTPQVCEALGRLQSVVRRIRALPWFVERAHQRTG